MNTNSMSLARSNDCKKVRLQSKMKTSKLCRI